jgi:hypothetical protein
MPGLVTRPIVFSFYFYREEDVVLEIVDVDFLAPLLN